MQWIKEHVRPGETIWVLPEYMQYSLMYYCSGTAVRLAIANAAGKAVRKSAEHSFFGMGLPPDYFIIFGLEKFRAEEVIKRLKTIDIEYRIDRPAEHFLERLDPAGNSVAFVLSHRRLRFASLKTCTFTSSRNDWSRRFSVGDERA